MRSQAPPQQVEGAVGGQHATALDALLAGPASPATPAAILALAIDLVTMGPGGRSSRLLRFLGTAAARALEATNRDVATAVASRTQDIYVCGGAWSLLGCQRAGLKSMEVLAAGSEGWEVGEPLKSHRFASSAAVLKGRLYICGGSQGHLPLRLVERYDPVIGKWQDLPSMLDQRSFAMAAALRGRVLVCGGAGVRDRTLVSAESFNPELNIWQPAPPMETARSWAAHVAVGDILFVMGGQGHNGVLRDAECFGGDAWRPLPRMRHCRVSFSACVLGKCVYVAGGYDGERPLRSAERLEGALPQPRRRQSAGPPSSHLGPGWQQLPNMTEARHGTGMLAVPALGCLYVFGGHDGSSSLSTVEAFVPLSGSWRAQPSLTGCHTQPVAALVAGELHVCAGHNGRLAFCTSEILDPSSSEPWQVLSMSTEDSQSHGRINAVGAVIARI